MVANRSPIVLTSLDFDRLEALLGTLPPGKFPNKPALEAELERADVVAPERIPANVVTMNSTVRFSIAQSGEEFTMTLVYPKDAGEPDRISVLAPVGSALLGLSVGDELDWPRPGGGISTVRVTDVVYQPERAGDLHR
ncbi:MAG TPA: nucleoside diphosphate kinase regulator [Gammaproteobacteria bacterium]|nr:nucleoside diphosphate kinase regulator [Gammaproteobacteria bacterium]